MAKLNLIAKPTFESEVDIPVAGEASVKVRFKFKHRTKSALTEFIRARPGKSDVESFLEMVEGWELADEFNKDSVELLLENYIGTALSTYKTYIDELTQAKTKNSEPPQ